jgi:hypothetical protein
MWLNLLSLGVKTGAKIYQNKQRTKQLMSDAQMHHAEQMAKGEIEYKAKHSCIFAYSFIGLVCFL